MDILQNIINFIYVCIRSTNIGLRVMMSFECLMSFISFYLSGFN